MGAKIINRGRGPEIEGTRITVYDVFDYARQGWHRDRIAALFRLSSRDIQAALDYIEQHRKEVTDAYQSIIERQKTERHPAEVEAKIAASRQRAKSRLSTERTVTHVEHNDDRNHG